MGFLDKLAGNKLFALAAPRASQTVGFAAKIFGAGKGGTAGGLTPPPPGPEGVTQSGGLTNVKNLWAWIAGGVALAIVLLLLLFRRKR